MFFSVHMDNRQQNKEMIQECIRKFICILLQYRMYNTSTYETAYNFS